MELCPDKPTERLYTLKDLRTNNAGTSGITENKTDASTESSECPAMTNSHSTEAQRKLDTYKRVDVRLVR